MLEKKMLPSTILFHGPEGVGKGLFALELAEKLVGKSKKHHPDIHILHPEEKSNQHPIAAIRLLIEEVGMPPFESPCKIFIIHDAEKMLPSSSNALLKTLEEPPSDTHFILLSSNPDHLLPTILSRCHRLPFFPIPEEEISQFLIAHGKTPEEAATLALFAEGSIGKALSLKSHREFVAELFEKHDYPHLVHTLSKLEDCEGESERIKQADQIFEEILYWIRTHHPLSLEKALPLIQQSREAIFHHVKLRNVLEHFFLCEI